LLQAAHERVVQAALHDDAHVGAPARHEFVQGVVGDVLARSRQALLLTTVEAFSPSEAAEILGISAEDVSGDLAEARQAISSQLIADVMVIEDEAIIALHIKSIVRDIGHNVVGIARTHSEAVALARQTSPELVLADISLADGSSGIDAVKDILEDMTVPVIFVTAFPERLLTGSRPEPTYLVMEKILK